MRFEPLSLAGAWLVELEPIADQRGFFARSWSAAEFERRGLNPGLVECGVSFNARRGTLRGLHWQASPHGEAKLVRCTRGAIHDVIVDLREGSPTRLRWESVTLSMENRRTLYVPEEFAHGFQTMEDETEVLYQISSPHHPEAARGIRWDDPALAIDWPLSISVVSERDRSHPPLYFGDKLS